MTGSIFDMFDSDAELEKTGVWLDYGNGARLKLARAGGANEKFKRLFTEKMKPHRRLVEAGQMPDELAEKIMHEVYAKTVLLDWTGVREKDGTEIPFTREAAMDAFARYPEFFQDVVAQAGKLSMFQRNAEEIDSGN